MSKKPKRKKRLDERIRKPISKPSRPLTSKKGKKGYDRKKEGEWENYFKE